MGRSDELQILVQAATTPPALALVEGEAGVGKTRLVNELLSSAALGSRRRLVGQCQPVREPFPFGPVVDALRDLHAERPRLQLSAVAGVVGDLLPELAPYLPPPPAPAGDPAAEQHRLWRALVELLNALGPTVLVLEDLHWADDVTAEFLRFLVAQQPARLAVVLTYRRDDLPPASPLAAVAARLPPATSVARIPLDPLGPEDVRQLIGSILSTDRVSPEFASFLHQRTGGIPLAVEEVLLLLVDRQDLVRLGGQWARRGLEELAVPHALRDSVLERVARLGADARRMARTAAVLGVPASEEMLATVAALAAPRAHAALVEAVEFGVLVPAPDGYGFRHSLAAQAVYDAVPAPQRRDLHERAAHALESSDPASLGHLAHHYHAAERPRKWVRYAEAAAEEALARGDYDSAARFLLEALAAPGLARATRARLAMNLGSAALSGLAHADAIPVLRKVLEEGDLQPSDRGVVRYFVAALLHQSGDAAASYAEMSTAVKELRRNLRWRCAAMAELASPTVPGVPVAEHFAWLEQAIALVGEQQDALNIKHTTEIAEATLLTAVGDPRARQLVTELQAAPTEAVRACTNIAFNQIVVGRYREADRLIHRGARIAESVEFHRLTGALAVDRLLLLWMIGRWEGLDAEINAVEEAATGLPPSRFQTGLLRGMLLLARGELAEAEPLLARAQEEARRTGAIPLMATAAAGLVRSQLAQGNSDEAVTIALGAMEAVASKGIWVWAADIGPPTVETLLLSGREGEAVALVEAFAGGIDGRDAPAPAAALAMCRGLMTADGDADEAAGWFGRAHSAWAALPRPYEAALAQERQGSTLVAGDRDGGTDALAGAVATFESLGATWDRDRAQRALRRHGVAVPGRRRGRTSYGNELSPREQEVAGLAVAGLSNAEIAERLFLSPRTVAHHLERAMRKRGAKSRWELRDSVLPPPGEDEGGGN